MAICESCGKECETTFAVVVRGQEHAQDCFWCAARAVTSDWRSGRHADGARHVSTREQTRIVLLSDPQGRAHGSVAAGRPGICPDGPRVLPR
jgi:hypothetical protein